MDKGNQSALILVPLTALAVGAQEIQFGVYIGDRSVVVPTTNFNLFSAGANSTNVFEGKVGIGTTSPTQALQ